MPAVAVIVVLATVFLLVRRIRNARRQDRKPPIDEAGAGVPTFRVVSLGPRGSGKTLLLASMYEQLYTWRDRQYYLEAPPDQARLLSSWFNELSDTAREWPVGTAATDMREFTFTVRHRPAPIDHAVMKLAYLEYAGALLTQPPEPGSTLWRELDERIAKAHALISIIDGHRIRQAIDGVPAGRAALQQTLTTMINRMLRVSAPITFVVTKWDLLRDLGPDDETRLHVVRECLLSNPGFRDLVEAHAARRVVRLIPVSAVGPDFAEIDDAGIIVKCADAHVEPTNIDIPLAAVLPDIFEQVADSMNTAKFKAMLANVQRQNSGGSARATAQLGRFVLRSAGLVAGTFNPVSAPFFGIAAAEFFPSGNDPAIDRALAAERRFDDAERRFNDFQLAQRRVMRDLHSAVNMLESRLPSSKLSGGR